MKCAVLIAWFPEALPLERHPQFHQHEAHMVSLYRKGALVAGGPFSDGSGSLLLLEAPDTATAQRWIEADPAHGTLYSAQIHAWHNVFEGH